LARGRVWTGEDAYKNGLVDVLGGFEDALKIAKKRIGIPENKKVKLKIYPEPEDGLNKILKMFGLSPSDGEDEDDARMSGIAKSLNIDKAILRSSMEALPPDARTQFDYMLQLYAISMQEKTMVALPWALNIR
jgi:ClpP class serine protease